MPKEYPRKLRVNAQLQRELAELIHSELRDPRVAEVTVTRVDAAPDLKTARVYVSVLALDAHAEEAVAALNGAAGRLRHALGHRLRLRQIPHLHFLADQALIEGDRVARLIREAVEEDSSYAALRGDQTDE